MRLGRRIGGVITASAAVVVFIITYLLILPALTLTPELACGKEEHIHNDSCYEVTYEEQLICPYEGMDVLHYHDELCYKDGVLVCKLKENYHPSVTPAIPEGVLAEETLAEDLTPVDDQAVALSEELSLDLEEDELLLDDGLVEGDVVEDVLSEDAIYHQHDKHCFAKVEVNRELICGQEEHMHSEACYADEDGVVLVNEEGDEALLEEEVALAEDGDEIQLVEEGPGVYDGVVFYIEPDIVDEAVLVEDDGAELLEDEELLVEDDLSEAVLEDGNEAVLAEEELLEEEPYLDKADAEVELAEEEPALSEDSLVEEVLEDEELTEEALLVEDAEEDSLILEDEEALVEDEISADEEEEILTEDGLSEDVLQEEELVEEDLVVGDDLEEEILQEDALVEEELAEEELLEEDLEEEELLEDEVVSGEEELLEEELEEDELVEDGEEELLEEELTEDALVDEDLEEELLTEDDVVSEEEEVLSEEEEDVLTDEIVEELPLFDQTLNFDGMDYHITVKGELPENVSLKAVEIDRDTPEYAVLLANAKDALGVEEVPREYARFFDITIMLDGQEYEPTAPLAVEILYDTPVTTEDGEHISANVVHFDKERNAKVLGEVREGATLQENTEDELVLDEEEELLEEEDEEVLVP